MQGETSFGADSYLVIPGDCSAVSNNSGVVVSAEGFPTAVVSVSKFDAFSIISLSGEEQCFCQSICEFMFPRLYMYNCIVLV